MPPVIDKSVRQLSPNIELVGGAQAHAHAHRRDQLVDVEALVIPAKNASVVDEQGGVPGDLKEVSRGDFSAKDFRTWHGTVLAALAVAKLGPKDSKTACKRAVNEAVKEVAEQLGNTPAVCRRSYIDPRIFDRYRDGSTIKTSLVPRDPARVFGARQQRSLERAVIRLIDD